MSRNVFLRSAYNYDMDDASLASGLFCPPEEGVTQQSFAEEVDINTIVRRFGLTGELPESPRAPMYGDFSDVMDFKSAMNAVRAAEEGFMEFPAHIRAEFQNDPQRMMEFLANDKNRERALEMGLIQKPAEVPRDMIRAIDDLSAKIVPPASSPAPSKV